MPLTAEQKAALVQKAQATLDAVNQLTVDTAPPPGGGGGTTPNDPPPPPPPPPPAPIERVKVGNKNGDGPTWEFANNVLRYPWKTAGGGGDMRDANDVLNGPTHWATIPAGAAPRTINVSLPPQMIVRAKERDAALFLNRAPVASPYPGLIASKEGADATKRPRLVVNGAEVPLIGDTWLDKTSNGTKTADITVKAPAIFVFDWNAVTAEPQTATLTLFHSAYGGDAMYVDLLDMPELITRPSLQLADQIEPGIAGTVAKDTDLKNHPDVIDYLDPKDAATVNAFFQWWNYKPGEELTAAGATEFVPHPEYGMTFTRVVNGPVPIGSTAVNRRVMWVNRPTMIKNRRTAIEVPFDQAYEELFVRYCLVIEDDVAVHLDPPERDPEYNTLEEWSNPQGTKLIGIQGIAMNYPDYAPDGAKWKADGWPGIGGNAGGSDGMYCLLEHDIPSLVNNRAMALSAYIYDEDKPARTNFPGGGRTIYTGSAVRPGSHVQSFELGIKLNDVLSTGPVRNGGLSIWHEGVLRFRSNQMLWRYAAWQRMMTLDWIIMHGGNKKPRRNQHYQIGGLAFARRYIGPPKKVA